MLEQVLAAVVPVLLAAAICMIGQFTAGQAIAAGAANWRGRIAERIERPNSQIGAARMSSNFPPGLLGSGSSIKDETSDPLPTIAIHHIYR